MTLPLAFEEANFLGKELWKNSSKMGLSRKPMIPEIARQTVV
ncbi:hypothetical protein LEP1GSC062_2667 [Leptospira alexanderi serovar Manhao 3 str. L 60]|uniref:Uncharacterized protein n=1 Tax=Leptospira alexanderi serovar Manhao 3 str. L 60 TaxID=1049759 RepID=V6HWW3_9LEPT|nr:hypothetical protein LEP1GSC062_2667 [Leptospira alexanderi serovar Manhao 3 str. L 60]